MTYSTYPAGLWCVYRAGNCLSIRHAVKCFFIFVCFGLVFCLFLVFNGYMSNYNVTASRFSVPVFACGDSMPLKGVTMSVSYSVSVVSGTLATVWCECCAESFVCRVTGIAEGYALDGVSTKLVTVEGVEFEVAPYVGGAKVCANCGDKFKPMLFTINRPLFGGAITNGLGEVRVFSSRELAEKHLESMGEYLGNGESTGGLVVYPVVLDGVSGMNLD